MKQPEKPEKWGKARPWILISAPAILKNKYFYFVAALFILALSIASGNGSMTVYYCGNILKDMDMMTPLFHGTDTSGYYWKLFRTCDC